MVDLTTITYTQFEAQFPRGFPYLPTYNSTQIYNTGDNSYFNNLFYAATQDGVINIQPGPSVPQWTQVQDSAINYVTPQDINNAFGEAMVNLNQGLFGSDANITLGYLYLTAHYLVYDLQAANAGLGGTPPNSVTARSAGSISESYAIPARFTNDPIVQFYSTTFYGRKYLSFVLPFMVGNAAAVFGGSGVPPWQIY